MDLLHGVSKYLGALLEVFDILCQPDVAPFACLELGACLLKLLAERLSAPPHSTAPQRPGGTTVKTEQGGQRGSAFLSQARTLERSTSGAGQWRAGGG